MKWNFRFQSILSLKMLQEETIERKLKALFAQKEQLSLRIAEYEESREKNESLMEYKMSRGLGAAEIQIFKDYSALLDHKILECKKDMATLEKELDACRKELSDKMKERKIFDRLKEKDRNAFLHMVEKKEQDAFDDLATVRAKKGGLTA